MLHFPAWKITIISLLCAAFSLLAIPSFLSEQSRASMPAIADLPTINLGLDLQGGSQLLLEVDFEAFEREQLANLMDEIRSKLRTEQIGYRGLSIKDRTIIFSLREAENAESVEPLLTEISPDIVISKAETGGYQIAFSEKWYASSKQQLLAQSLQIIDRRVNETGTKEPIIQRQGDSRILLQVPGLADPEHLKNLLGRTAKMTFHLVDETVRPEDMERGIAPSGTRIVQGDDRDGGKPHKYALYSRAVLSGDLLVDANTSYNQKSGQPVIAFRFNSIGARKFGEITSQHVGKPFAIVLDNKVITAPVINEPILAGSGEISGNFTTESANELALLLRAGALPAPLNVIEERSVGPSLGSDSIEAGSLAAIVAIALVVSFMIIMYGLFGLFANIAMVINSLMTISLLSLFGATLTLPGIAGIVLSVGMAVDANVLIYERIREELRNGKSIYKAIEDGFKMASATILDSQITTLIAALILFVFGTGTIKGFAVTLAVGNVCSLFTAMLVTRMMVALWLQKTKPKTLSI